jgi:hypothetical protein
VISRLVWYKLAIAGRDEADDMSETMSSGDIEDVLSSIRRLVSDDNRPAPKAEPKPASSSAKGGKLLLTPALRVVTTNGQESPAALRAPEPAQDFLPEDEAPFIDVEDDDFGHVVKFGGEMVAKPAQRPEAEPLASAAIAEPSDEASRAKARKLESPDLTRVVNDIAAGFSESDADWESETGDSPVAEDMWQVPAWGAIADDALATDQAVADIAENAAISEILAQDLQEPIAKAATAAVQNQSDVAEDDADFYFDEAMLRDMVRDLIREELSGTLGERITRNVRKLVRAEIARALSARDLG